MVSLLKIVCSHYVWIVLSFVVLIPDASVYAQDPDEEGEIFWDEEEDEDIEEDEFEEEDEYLDDDDYYGEDEDEEDYSLDEDEYSSGDGGFIDDEDDYGEDEDEAASAVDRSGWSVDFSGSTTRLVNYTLWKEYGLAEEIWEPKMGGRVSIEAPYMFNLLGLRFRAGAEFGSFGFTDLTPRAEIGRAHV